MRPGPAVTRATVVIGRDAELDRLRNALLQSAAGRPTTTLLVGEGGVGKTRLLGEVAAVAADRGLSVLTGSGPITAAPAFSVITEALRSWLRLHPFDDALVPYDRGLRLVLPEWPLVSPGAELDHGQLRLLALEGVVTLLRAIAVASGGAVLLTDDLHAADPESLEALRYIAAARIDGLAVVGGLRPSESARADELVRTLSGREGAEIIDVSPLDERAVGELVAVLLDAKPPSALIADVLARTDGLPLLVEELVRGHLLAGTVTVDRGGASWRGGAAGVPGTIRDLVHARLAMLDGVERDVIVAGAIVGDFDPQTMRAVSGADDAQIALALGAGIRAGVLESSGGRIAFRHAIVRDAVIEGTVPHVVDVLHRRAADARRADDDAERLERRAHHLAAVGEWDTAAGALVQAASLLLHGHALVAAERAARRARESARSPERRALASDVLATILGSQGRWTEALELGEATVAEHGDSADRRLRRATAALEAGRPEVAESVLATALVQDPTTTDLLLVAGRVAIVRGRADEALESAERVLGDDTAGIDARLAALDLRARSFDFLGERERAQQSWRRQARDARAAGRSQAHIRAVVQLGKIELFAGAPPNAVYEAVELARSAGSLVELAWAQENLVVALALRGDLAAAAAILDEAIERCQALHLDQLAYLLAGRAMTRSYFQESVDADFDEIESTYPTPDLLLHTAGMRGDIAVRRGRWEEARRWFERGVALSTEMPGVVPMDSVCWLPWVLAMLGREKEAGRALAHAQAVPDLARFYTRPVIVAAAEAFLARDVAGVDAAIAAAPGLMPLETATMRVMGAHRFDGEARTRWLREAVDIYDACGSPIERDRVRQRLRAAGGAVPRRRSPSRGVVPAALAAAGVTAREAEVLRLLASGQPNADIAALLFVSVRTVEAHVSSLLRRLGARNRGELVARSASIDFDA